MNNAEFRTYISDLEHQAIMIRLKYDTDILHNKLFIPLHVYHRKASIIRIEVTKDSNVPTVLDYMQAKYETIYTYRVSVYYTDTRYTRYYRFFYHIDRFREANLKRYLFRYYYCITFDRSLSWAVAPQ